MLSVQSHKTTPTTVTPQKRTDVNKIVNEVIEDMNEASEEMTKIQDAFTEDTDADLQASRDHSMSDQNSEDAQGAARKGGGSGPG